MTRGVGPVDACASRPRRRPSRDRDPRTARDSSTTIRQPRARQPLGERRRRRRPQPTIDEVDLVVVAVARASWPRPGTAAAVGVEQERASRCPGHAGPALRAPRAHAAAQRRATGSSVEAPRRPPTARGQVPTPQAHVAARVGRAAEADLVPRPRVRVERRQRVAHDHATRRAPTLSVLAALAARRRRTRPTIAPALVAARRSSRRAAGRVEPARRPAARSRGRRACRRSGSRRACPAASFGVDHARAPGCAARRPGRARRRRTRRSVAASAGGEEARAAGRRRRRASTTLARDVVPVAAPARARRSRGSGRASAASCRGAGAAARRVGPAARPAALGQVAGLAEVAPSALPPR